jgi:DNA helicase-2/ATP-dependent DNA helicase PcrA
VGAVDFDDLLVLTARLFESFPQVCRRYQDRFRHVLIDEYQDTNRVQYRIARALCGDGRDLFVVGDEDQGIYSWRGASIRNIVDFKEDFPNATVYRLEQNYRSTSAILALANAVVAKNVRRLGKTLWCSQTGGGLPRCFEAANADEEARFVAEDIVRRSLSPRQVAILFRTNQQSRLIEEALRRKGLAYVVVGGVRFYGRKEIKDILSYLRLLANPADDVSLIRILNVPTRGIGATSQARLEEYARERRMALFEVLREVEHDETFPARLRNALHEFVQLVDDLSLRTKSLPLASLVEELLGRTGYREHLRLADEKDFRTRIENVGEFLSGCAEYDTRGDGGLAEFLQELALVTDVDEWDESLPTVTLMTCHSAKGLEFDSVYLIGLEEGLFPHASASDSPEELEEERRLCYVAMTRARNDLTLCAARKRLQYGVATDREISSFLKEISSDLVERVGENGQPLAGVATVRSAEPRGVDARRIKMGTPVLHAKFGKGVVMYTSGNGEKLRARIRFQSGRSMDLMVRVAPLQILDGGER